MLKTYKDQFVSFFIFTVVILFSYPTYAAKQLDAHEHGHGTLSIAIEDEHTAIIELEAPAESIYGFEHKAKSTKDKQAQAKDLEKLKNHFKDMVQLDPKLGCNYTNDKINVMSHADEEAEEHDDHEDDHHVARKGEHSEVHATFTVKCREPLYGHKVNFQITKVFPRLKKVNVQVLSKHQQTSKTIVNDKGSIRL